MAYAVSRGRFLFLEHAIEATQYNFHDNQGLFCFINVVETGAFIAVGRTFELSEIIVDTVAAILRDRHSRLQTHTCQHEGHYCPCQLHIDDDGITVILLDPLYV